MKKCLVAGGNGFIGHHLANRLKKRGCWVRVADINGCEYSKRADETYIMDLRNKENCITAMKGGIDEVYQLAADMGGMGFISSHEIDCLTNNVQINANMAQACVETGIPNVFYSSSVCIYPDMKIGDSQLMEEQAYPANPDNEYGWEKLYSERIWLAVAKNAGVNVRIARFQNCYGPEGTWYGGREKAPAALCRKVAMAENNGDIEVWGTGVAVRNYIYIEDLLDGIQSLMESDITTPVNIGTEEYVSVDELIDIIETVAKKQITRKYVKGPVGVLSRNFSHRLIQSTGWHGRVPLKKGIKKTYYWILKELNRIPIIESGYIFPKECVISLSPPFLVSSLAIFIQKKYGPISLSYSIAVRTLFNVACISSQIANISFLSRSNFDFAIYVELKN